MLVLGLTLLAAVPRLDGLDRLGFYGDEETTALPARALAESGEARMPSGMPYTRALPATWLNALSANAFGVEREFSYRLPTAIFGTLTVPLLFLLARGLFGTGVALIAALMLALSEWHILTSREARMYAPFLFFYLATALMLLRWIRDGDPRRLFGACAAYLAAASLHIAAAMIALFPLLALAWPAWRRPAPAHLIALAAAAAGIAWIYDRIVVATAFKSLKTANPTDETGESAAPSAATTAAELPIEILLMGGLGACLGIWLMRRMRRSDEDSRERLRMLGQYSAAALAGGLTAAGQLHGAAIAWIAVLLLVPRPPLRAIAAPAAALALAAAVHALHAFFTLGVTDGARALLMFPFPYAWWLGEALGGVFALFLLGTILLVLTPAAAHTVPLRISALAVWIPVFAMGIAEPWGGIRYLIQVYPFLLIVAAYALLRAGEAVVRYIPRLRTRPENAALAIAVVISISGVLGSHGLVQGLAIAGDGYGPARNTHALGFPVYPDHKGAGEYVRMHRLDGDLVVAEDPLQQYWYAGPVDYWLRDPESHRHFMFFAPDGKWRDIYVASAALETGFAEALASASRPLWIITSGETYHRREQYLSEEQRRWLEEIERTHHPRYRGRDGATAVYCLNCAGGAQLPERQ